MRRTKLSKAIGSACALCLGWLGAPVAMAEWELNMPKGVTDVSRDVYDLHMLIFWVCVAIGIAVFGVMIYSIINHRKSKGVEPAKFSHSAQAEFIWTIIPVVILIGTAIPAAGTLVRMEDTRDPEITIKITGYQWRWHYEYLDEGIGFFSSLSADSNAARQLRSGTDPFQVPNYLRDVDNPMVVPVDTKVRGLITAADVLHAWWVPELAVKKDAVPGFINEIWFNINEEGVYRGQCAELCGRGHGFMPVVVVAKSKADYAAWLREQRNKSASAQHSQDGPDVDTVEQQQLVVQREQQPAQTASAKAAKGREQ